jgi:hypothetical protein
MQTPIPSAPIQGEQEPSVGGENEPPIREEKEPGAVNDRPNGRLYEELLQLENNRLQRQLDEANIQRMEEARIRQIEEAKIRQIEIRRSLPPPLPSLWYMDQTLANLHYNKLLKLKKGIENRLKSLIIHTKYDCQNIIYNLFIVALSLSSIILLSVLIADGTKNSLIIASLFALVGSVILFLLLVYLMAVEYVQILSSNEHTNNLNTFYIINGYNLQFMIPLE